MRLTFISSIKEPKACRVDELKRGIFGRDVKEPTIYYAYHAKAGCVTVFYTLRGDVITEPIALYAHEKCVPQPAGSSFKIEG